MKATKRALIVSGFTLLVCFALLTGTTFAWLTDSVSNKGNKIQSGALKISASLYSQGENGIDITIPGYSSQDQDGEDQETVVFDQDGLDLTTSPDDQPLIEEQDFGPGSTQVKMIRVSNEEDLSTKINFRFTVETDDLTNALWFDFIPLDKADPEGVKTRTLVKRPMTELSDVVSAQEFSLASGQDQYFLFVYGMSDNAGGGYQGKKFVADVSILAAQGGEEVDGFGHSSYDENASYDAVTVSTALQLDQALRVGGNIKLGADIDMTEYDGGPWEISQDTILDLDGKQLTVKNGNGSGGQIVVSDPVSFTIKNGGFTTVPNGSPVNKAVLQSYGTLVLENMTIGGGDVHNLVEAENGFLTMTSCQVSSTKQGTGTWLVTIGGDSTEAVLTNCSFETGKESAALYITSPAEQVQLAGCTINGQPMDSH